MFFCLYEIKTKGKIGSRHITESTINSVDINISIFTFFPSKDFLSWCVLYIYSRQGVFRVNCIKKKPFDSRESLRINKNSLECLTLDQRKAHLLVHLLRLLKVHLSMFRFVFMLHYVSLSIYKSLDNALRYRWKMSAVFYSSHYVL